LWAVGFLAAAVFAVLFGIDFAQGKALYAALASYHAYLELPVLLAMLVGARSLTSLPTPPPADAATTTTVATPSFVAPSGAGGSGGLGPIPETAAVAVAPAPEVGT
ncbi:MAG: hypothetical protein ACKOVB_03900, partial [Terrabacter sp.]